MNTPENQPDQTPPLNGEQSAADSSFGFPGFTRNFVLWLSQNSTRNDSIISLSATALVNEVYYMFAGPAAKAEDKRIQVIGRRTFFGLTAQAMRVRLPLPARGTMKRSMILVLTFMRCIFMSAMPFNAICKSICRPRQC